MIKLDEGFLSWKDYKLLFSVLKDGGLIRCCKFAITLEKAGKAGFSIKVFALGEDIDKKVYINGEQPEDKPKQVEVESKSNKGGLFDDI